MKVYLALMSIPYEGDTILAAYATEASAEARCAVERAKGDDYVTFVIEEFEVLP